MSSRKQHTAGDGWKSWMQRWRKGEKRVQQEIRFVVWGEPQGKGRPKFSRHGNYVRARTPEKTAVYENLVQMEYQRQCGDVRFSDTDSLQMDITAFYTIPASVSRNCLLYTSRCV